MPSFIILSVYTLVITHIAFIDQRVQSYERDSTESQIHEHARSPSHIAKRWLASGESLSERNWQFRQFIFSLHLLGNRLEFVLSVPVTMKSSTLLDYGLAMSPPKRMSDFDANISNRRRKPVSLELVRKRNYLLLQFIYFKCLRFYLFLKFHFILGRTPM